MLGGIFIGYRGDKVVGFIGRGEICLKLKRIVSDGISLATANGCDWRR